MRSLGQAFDVCHKLNPRPQKKKKTSKETTPDTESSSANDKEESPSTEKKLEENGIQDESKPTGEAWKKFEDSTEKPSEVKGNGVMEDLMQLNFDPFITPGNLPQSTQMANGSSTDPFQPHGVAGGMGYPMLTVGNMSTTLPDFPDGVDPALASANVLPPHMALLGRPRPRPTSAGHNQVGGAGFRILWRHKCA